MGMEWFIFIFSDYTTKIILVSSPALLPFVARNGKNSIALFDKESC